MSLEPLPENVLEQLKKTFNRFDKGKKGKITAHDLHSIMKAIGENPSDEEVHKMIHAVNKNDSSNTVNLQSFIELMTKYMNYMNQHQEKVAMFNIFDQNGDGLISNDELYHVMKGLDSQITEQDIKKMFETADLDHDGFINFSEFTQVLNLMNQTSSHPTAKTSSSSSTNRVSNSS